MRYRPIERDESTDLRDPVRAALHHHVKCARLGLDAEAPITCEQCFRSVAAAAARSGSDPSGLEPAASHSQAR
jgi:hypothetical protein